MFKKLSLYNNVGKFYFSFRVGSDNFFSHKNINNNSLLKRNKQKTILNIDPDAYSCKNKNLDLKFKPQLNLNILDDYSQMLDMLTGFQLYFNQFKALMEKKALHSRRNWFLLLVQATIPLVIITIIIFVVRSCDGTKDLPRLELSLKTYNSTVTLIQHDSSLPDDSIEGKIFRSYREELKDNKEMFKAIDKYDMTNHYLNISREFQVRINRVYLYGVSIVKSNITAWYNNKPYHTPPISLSLVHNAVLKAVTGKDCSIAVANKPLPYQSESRLMMQKGLSNLGFQLSLNIGFAMAIVSSFFVISCVKERVTKAKLLQFVSGTNVAMYWLTAFLWDFIVFTVIALLMTATIGVFNEDGYNTMEELSIVFLVFMMFGVAILPFVYIAAFFFNGAASGFTKLIIIFMFPGVAMFTVEYFMRFKEFNLKDFAETLTEVFLTVPHYSLSNAINNINLVNVIRNDCEMKCDKLGICGEMLYAQDKRCKGVGYFDWEEPGISRNLVYFLCFSIGAFIVLFIVEFRLVDNFIRLAKVLHRVACGLICRSSSRQRTDDELQCDADVMMEKEKINYILPEQYKNFNLVMKNVSLNYGDFQAVNSLCLGITRSECFGLLG